MPSCSAGSAQGRREPRRMWAGRATTSVLSYGPGLSPSAARSVASHGPEPPHRDGSAIASCRSSALRQDLALIECVTSAGVLDHLAIQCADVARSAHFYDAVLAPLGGQRIIEYDRPTIGFGVPPLPNFWLDPRLTGNVLSALRCAPIGLCHDATRGEQIGTYRRDRRPHPRIPAASSLHPAEPTSDIDVKTSSALEHRSLTPGLPAGPPAPKSPLGLARVGGDHPPVVGVSRV
jgi:hypothetical protein